MGLVSTPSAAASGRLLLHRIRTQLLLAGVLHAGKFYAWGALEGVPTAPSYSSLLRLARRAALLVQAGKNNEDLTRDENILRYDWSHGVDEKRRRRHMLRARATLLQQDQATRGSGISGNGLSAASMGAAEPVVTFSMPSSFEHRAKHRPRPRLPVSRWRAEHRRRCNLCTQGHGCQFVRLARALKYGWVIPVAYMPAKHRQKNYNSAIESAPAVDSFISGLVDRGAMYSVGESERALIESPLGVVFRVTDTARIKPRVTLDASISGVNAAQPPWLFSYAGADDLTSAVQSGWWMAKLDLKGYYNQLPVHPVSQQLLGIRWRGQSYIYSSVPFGVSLACAFASWVSAELREMMKARGIPVVISYIDDFLLAAPTESDCREALRIALQLLKELGVVVAELKTEGPAQRLEFLGVVYDTCCCSISLAAAKAIKLQSALNEVACLGTATSSSLSSLAGRLLWFSQVRPFLRWLAQPLWTAASAMHPRAVTLTDDLRSVLKNAAASIVDCAPAPILSWHTSPLDTAVLLRCDASGPHGAGGHWGHLAFTMPGFGWWKRSANMVAKELVPVVRALEVWGHRWRGKVVLVCLDNEGAVFAWNAGHSNNSLTQHVLQQLHLAVEAAGAFLIAMQIPRELNRLSDALSHFDRFWIGQASWTRGQLRTRRAAKGQVSAPPEPTFTALALDKRAL